MSFKKSGNNYTVEFDGVKTIFNLDGTIIKQSPMTQEEAVAFLQLNGYKAFEVDKKPVAKPKVAAKVEIDEE